VPFPPDRRPLPLLRTPSRLRVRALLGALVFTACSGGTDLLLPGDGQPAQIELRKGGDQTGRVGEPLADSLVFAVLDSRSRGVEGAQVVFELSSAGPGADVVPDTATTDADGMAKVRMVLGTRIGPQSGEARVLVPDGTREPTTTFTIMAFAENADGMSAISGDEQIAPAGSALPQPLVIQVTDAFGNPISGVPITWTAPEGGSVSETSNLTDGDGRASVVRTLGPTAGIQTTVATSEQGLAGSPVTFTSTATAGSAAGLSIVSGNEQTAQAGTELPGDLVVRLVDASGNGVPNAAVTWVVGTGGGRVSPENTRTDEAGRTSTRWTLGPSPGPNRVDAVVSGVGVVNFTATGTAVVPARLTMVTQPSASTQNGVRLERQPVVRVQDGRAGIVVTAQLSGGSGELLGTRQLTTGSDGSAAFADLAIAGAEGARTLVFTASGYAGVSSSVIEVRPIATSTTITSDSPDPSIAGGTITVAFQVSSAGPVPVGSVTVTVSDGAATCSGLLQGGTGSCQMALNRTGDRTLRASYSGAPGFLASSGTAGHRVDSPAPENRPPDAEYRSQCEALTCQFTDRSDDRDGQVTGWSWNFGDGTAPVTEQNPTHTFPSAGSYTVTLTATDDRGASNTATATVKVEAPPPPPANKAPQADFEVQCTDLTCSFSDKSKDDDGTIVSRVWDYGDGSPPSSTPSHTYAAEGKYQVTLTVTDDDGAVDSRSHDANPKAPPPPNQPPTAAFSENCTNLDCSFNSEASSDPEGGITRSWNFGDGSGGSDAVNPSHTYPSAGTYNVTLTVSDDDGASDSETHQVTVTAPNQSPTAAFTQTCDGLVCNFSSAGSTDPDGDLLSYEWDFDDHGGQSTEANPAYTFSEAGQHNVRLRVRDNRGGEGQEQHLVDVTAPAP